MAGDRAFADEVTGRLLPFGPVTARRMFGGFGVYLDGVMFGLIARNALYFKADDGNRETYVGAGMGPFTYQGRNKPVSLSYWRVPDDVFDDPGRLAEWAEGALAAARRAKNAKNRPKRRRSG